MFNASWRNILLSAVVVIALGVFVIWRHTRDISLGEQDEPKTEQVSNETEKAFSSKLPGIEYEFAPSSGTEGKVEVAETPVHKPLKAIPDLSRSIPDSVRPKERAEMEWLASELEKNPYNAALWSELGLYRKESSDYEGVRLAWEFAYELQPENTVIGENLGVLYGYYLKNGLKSEEFFRAAIALEPQNINLRFRLFDLYREVFQDKAKARAAIEDALKDNPGDEQLTALLGEL